MIHKEQFIFCTHGAIYIENIAFGAQEVNVILFRILLMEKCKMIEFGWNVKIRQISWNIHVVMNGCSINWSENWLTTNTLLCMVLRLTIQLFHRTLRHSFQLKILRFNYAIFLQLLVTARKGLWRKFSLQYLIFHFVDKRNRLKYWSWS